MENSTYLNDQLFRNKQWCLPNHKAVLASCRWYAPLIRSLNGWVLVFAVSNMFFMSHQNNENVV